MDIPFITLIFFNTTDKLLDGRVRHMLGKTIHNNYRPFNISYFSEIILLISNNRPLM